MMLQPELLENFIDGAGRSDNSYTLYIYIHISALKKIYASKANTRRSRAQIEHTRSYQGDCRRQGVTEGQESIAAQPYESRGDIVSV